MKQPWILSRKTFMKATAQSALLLASGAGMTGCRASRPILRIGLVSDTHYADREPAGTRFYRESLGKLKECVDRMNEERVDFMVHLGDFKDQDSEPEEARTLRYVKDLESVYAKFNGPRYHLLGNHDVDSISKEQFGKMVENTGIETGATYYSFDRGRVHIVVLDATFRQDGVAYDKGNFDWKDTAIPSDQLAWLKEDLGKTDKPALVFVHQLLDPMQSEQHQVKNAAAVRDLLEASGKVLAVF
ncbi:MAG: metallophosphoesterase, partial [Verrucomicrobiae bacterium]|nr:metallophosphoesterase [Verrucomicrobiae bacterium]